jgi:hypothetical protein
VTRVGPPAAPSRTEAGFRSVDVYVEGWDEELHSLYKVK